MVTRWDSWLAIAASFATEARERGVPTTTTFDGRWYEWDRNAWAFKVVYYWTPGAGALTSHVTVAKNGRLVEVDNGPQTRPFKADTEEGMRQIEPHEEQSVRAAFTNYIKRNATR